MTTATVKSKIEFTHKIEIQFKSKKCGEKTIKQLLKDYGYDTAHYNDKKTAIATSMIIPCSDLDETSKKNTLDQLNSIFAPYNCVVSFSEI